MKISCCWLFAISKYGYPPSLPDTHRALEEMEALGFKNVELEGVGEENLRAVYDARQELKKRCEDLGLTVVNFCPVLPDLVHPDKARRVHALDVRGARRQIRRVRPGTASGPRSNRAAGSPGRAAARGAARAAAGRSRSR